MRIKLIIFLSINLAIAALAALASPSLTSGPEYRRYKVAFDYVDELQPGQRIDVIIGDSRPECCIDAGAMGFVNLSLAGGTPVEGLYQLQQILDKGVKIGRVIISYGPNHIFSQDTYYSRAQYFGFLDDSYLDAVDELVVTLDDKEYKRYQWGAVEVVDEYLPFLSVKQKFAVVNVLSMDQTVSGVLDEVRARFSGTSRSMQDDQNRKKLHSIIATDDINRGEQPPELELVESRSPVNEHYLGKIVELAEERGIEIYYLVMPFNSGVDHADQAFYDRFRAVLADNGLAHCSSHFRFWPNEQFFDSSHLNRPGASRLAEELDSALNFCMDGDVGVVAQQRMESDEDAATPELR